MGEEALKKMQGTGLAEHNVVASFPDMESGAAAVDALERGGIDGASISLLGKAVEEAAAETETTERDAGVAERVGKRAAIGAAAGTAAGGLTGFLAGLAAFAIPGVGPVVGTGVWAATAAGAVAGGGVGGVVGGVSAIDMTEAWELTQEAVRAGRVMVGVHSEDRAISEKGEEILRRRDPLRVDRYDRQGRRVSHS
jgi:hypothetical protein